jgi:hypothetical protein
VARFGVADLDVRAATRIATDVVDTAEGIQQIAVAIGDVAQTVRADHHQPPSNLARGYRKPLADELRDMFDDETEGTEISREIGQGIAQLLTVRREARVKAAQDRAKDEENRRFLARLKEADDSPEALARKFAEIQRSSSMVRGASRTGSRCERTSPSVKPPSTAARSPSDAT